ncbi:hypothetical protein RF11_09644 [Thelohanellus kitauei]|uniref:Uncharacterized protein n=1 Tax=Thelohanellus kitauei TaxID=669202 RepID=A0A0C2N2A7_THEKT|nr:hypothetical protein RF11_09644 [Thelohanellus kitauei]
MYRLTDLKYNTTSDYMSCMDFEDMARSVHFNYNGEIIVNCRDNHYDLLFKIRPLLNMLTTQFLLVAPGQRQSIDEQQFVQFLKAQLRLMTFWFYYVGSLCTNRIHGFSSKSEAALKKTGSGSFDRKWT